MKIIKDMYAEALMSWAHRATCGKCRSILELSIEDLSVQWFTEILDELCGTQGKRPGLVYQCPCCDSVEYLAPTEVKGHAAVLKHLLPKE